MINILVQSPLRPYFYLFCLSRRCPLLATFLFVFFCLLSLLISERFSGLISFCVLHPLPLPLSSCLGCIPPLIGLSFLRFHAIVSSLFLLFVFSILFCLSRRCHLLATFLSVLFCLLSLLISERFSGLIWFGSVYLVSTAGFVADQLM